MSKPVVVPIIDVADFATVPSTRAGIGAAVDSALRDCGFMYVRGSGVEPALVERAFAVAGRFFAPLDLSSSQADCRRARLLLDRAVRRPGQRPSGGMHPELRERRFAAALPARDSG